VAIWILERHYICKWGPETEPLKASAVSYLLIIEVYRPIYFGALAAIPVFPGQADHMWDEKLNVDPRKEAEK